MKLLQVINSTYDIKTHLIIYVILMLVLFLSFLIAFLITQRKKLQHQKDLDTIRQAQQNQLIEAAVRSEETERHRIAETLHDEVGAILSSSKLHWQGIKYNSLDDRDKGLYEKGKELLDDGIQRVRGISHNLHSSVLKEFGLNEAIRHFVNTTLKGTMIEASTNLDDHYKTENPENDISIYRIVQELINNILKYANAKELNIRSTFAEGQLDIIIEHNGIGLSQNQFQELRYKKEGLGLKNIQNRVILLKGSIYFGKVENGYLVNITAPINSKI